ncbi:TIGR02281 family clan AA aspartic protease [Rhizobiaceae bacterium BDR2-2]|uniref:TIGR02281 family clan AA aspartic protease n=1 Tax=Ectorhizobium quercum TaxID=2965071 RepID=A0AAE3N5U1_9HYPH|nr:TIGR02281 family clan AA aspartic protease [Ectorhizobium quercum]MCX8999810.1 TIGR02281 family clan AA aspartic protease [Ectorhizobium quercum]
MNRYTIGLLILAVSLALLIFNHGAGETFGVDNDRFAELMRLLTLTTVIGAGILISRRYTFGKVARDLAIWLVIILALIVLWLYRGDFRSLGDRVFAALVPGQSVISRGADGTTEIILHKSMNGHFEAVVEINGQAISVLVDTGASAISLSWEDALAAGLNPDNLTYSATVRTANGLASAAPVRLAQVSLGPITRRNVPALVATKDRLEQSLLGMSFLSTLGSLRMEADELRLRD